MYILLGFAYAGIPVVFDGADAAAAVAQAAGRSGLPTSQLEAVALETLLQAPARATGDAVLRHCAGKTTLMSELRTTQARAEAAWSRGEADAALDQLDLAVAQLGCLTERVEVPVATRIFLLRGGLLALRGDTEGAREELRSALAFDGTLVWEERFPAPGGPLLAAVREERLPLTLAVYPPDLVSGPWISGHTPAEWEAAGGLQVGLHLLQIATPAGLRSAWLLASGPSTLVVPVSYRLPLPLTEPAQQLAVGHLLWATLPSFQAAYVSSQGGLWLVTLEEGAPRLTELLPIPAPVVEPTTKKKR